MGYNFSQNALAESVLEQAGEGADVTVCGRIVECYYQKPDTGFGIYGIENEDFRRIKVVGVFASKINYDLYYEFTGKSVKKSGEWQLEVSSYKQTFPTSPAGIMGVLKTLSGLNTQANIVYNVLGKDSLRLIHDNPKEVADRLPGVSLKRAKIWQQELSATDEVERTIPILTAMGFNMSKARKLIEEFGPTVGELIRNDPYFLVSRGGHISFADCDKVALKNGTKVDNVFRIMAAMTSILRNTAYMEGNCFLYREEFFEKLSDLVGIYLKARDVPTIMGKAKQGTQIMKWSQYGASCEVELTKLKESFEAWSTSKKKDSFRYYVYRVPEAVIDQAVSMALAQKIIVEDEVLGRKIYLLDSVYQAECSVAASIRNIQAADMSLRVDTGAIIDKYLASNGITLEEKQLEAVRKFTATKGGFHVLQGVAGGGKTFTLNVVIKVLGMIYRMYGKGFNAVILAPTGKAAKVASNATGLPASTIHKALHLVSDDEGYSNVDLQSDCVIIDEFSMVDIFLAKKLFESIQPTTKVIVIGDSNQLPSIGPGNVLYDIVSCGKVDTVTLSVVKRQAEGSGCLINANKILRGEMISTEKPGGGTTNAGIVVNVNDTVRCRDAVVKKYKELIQSGVPISDIQVLCPQKKTEVGTDVLNLLLQKVVSHDNETDIIPVKEVSYMNGEDMETETLYFKKGDKVIHTENNYKMEWYYKGRKGLVKDPIKKGIINGEVGVIVNTAIEGNPGNEEYQILVRYDDGYVLYQGDEIKQLQHAFAMTIHKSQGSQWLVTISPIMKCNFTMLARNLLYTAYTRASSTNYLFGQPDAISYAISNTAYGDRKTSLAYRI